MDRVAAAAGLSADELRRRNFISTGQANAVGQIVRERVDMPRLLDRAFELSGYKEKSARFAREHQHGPLRRGIGFACFMHGAGFTGSGEQHLASVASVEVLSPGLTMCRSRMPVRDMIQSSEVLTMRSRSAFVRTRGGT